MSEIDSILAETEYAHLVFQKVRDRIFRTKCGHQEPFESYWPRLTEGEKAVILTNGFIWESNNGGLSQFLSNSTGDHAEDLRGVFRSIGAVDALAALAEISNLIFSGGPIPKDRMSRCEALFAWEKADQARANALFSKWADTLDWCESVEFAIASYIRDHKEMF